MSQSVSLPRQKPLSASHTDNWTETGVHEFMLHDAGAVDPIDVILDIRSGIARLPETATLFTLDRVLDQHTSSDVSPEYLALAGSWQVPKSLVGSRLQTKYINPAIEDKHEYTDVTVRCACGIAFNNSLTATPHIPGSQDHKDNCKPQYHYEALAELWKRREEVAKTMLLLGTWSGRDVANRVGIIESQVGRFSTKLNFSIGEYRQTGRQLLANTAVELLEKHSMAKVACAYNYSKSRLRKIIRDNTDADLNELIEERKALDRRGEWIPEHSRGEIR